MTRPSFLFHVIASALFLLTLASCANNKSDRAPTTADAIEQKETDVLDVGQAKTFICKDTAYTLYADGRVDLQGKQKPQLNWKIISMNLQGSTVKFIIVLEKADTPDGSLLAIIADDGAACTTHGKLFHFVNTFLATRLTSNDQATEALLCRAAVRCRRNHESLWTTYTTYDGEYQAAQP